MLFQVHCLYLRYVFFLPSTFTETLSFCLYFNLQEEAYSRLQHFVRQSLPTKSLQIIGPYESAQRAKLNQLTAR